MEIHPPAGEFCHQRKLFKRGVIDNLHRFAIDRHGVDLCWPAPVNLRHCPCLMWVPRRAYFQQTGVNPVMLRQREYPINISPLLLLRFHRRRMMSVMFSMWIGWHGLAGK